MPDKSAKTQRILIIYHLLRHCDEVSLEEIAGTVSGCKKTYSRDIALLKKAGVPIRYSAKRRAFVLDYRKPIAAKLPYGKSERRYIEKIVRLIEVMDSVPYEDCDKWYAETFPEISKRTMQRDFAELTEIGYRIKYERSEMNDHDAGTDVPPGHYYCDRPNGAYGLFWNS